MLGGSVADFVLLFVYFEHVAQEIVEQQLHIKDRLHGTATPWQEAAAAGADREELAEADFGLPCIVYLQSSWLWLRRLQSAWLCRLIFCSLKEAAYFVSQAQGGG